MFHRTVAHIFGNTPAQAVLRATESGSWKLYASLRAIARYIWRRVGQGVCYAAALGFAVSEEPSKAIWSMGFLICALLLRHQLLHGDHMRGLVRLEYERWRAQGWLEETDDPP